MSASSTPTRRPISENAAARLTVSDDLPTPPLPEATAITRVDGSSWIDLWLVARPAPRLGGEAAGAAGRPPRGRSRAGRTPPPRPPRPPSRPDPGTTIAGDN